jgi:hypothetical protein
MHQFGNPYAAGGAEQEECEYSYMLYDGGAPTAAEMAAVTENLAAERAAMEAQAVRDVVAAREAAAARSRELRRLRYGIE